MSKHTERRGAIYGKGDEEAAKVAKQLGRPVERFVPDADLSLPDHTEEVFEKLTDTVRLDPYLKSVQEQEKLIKEKDEKRQKELEKFLKKL